MSETHQEASRLDLSPPSSTGCAAHAHSPSEQSRVASPSQLPPHTRLPAPHSACARSTACAVLCGANKRVAHTPSRSPASAQLLVAPCTKHSVRKTQPSAATACSASTAPYSPAHPFAHHTLCHTPHSLRHLNVRCEPCEPPPLHHRPPPKLSSRRPLPHTHRTFTRAATYRNTPVSILSPVVACVTGEALRTVTLPTTQYD